MNKKSKLVESFRPRKQPKSIKTPQDLNEDFSRNAEEDYRWSSLNAHLSMKTSLIGYGEACASSQSLKKWKIVARAQHKATYLRTTKNGDFENSKNQTSRTAMAHLKPSSQKNINPIYVVCEKILVAFMHRQWAREEIVKAFDEWSRRSISPHCIAESLLMPVYRQGSLNMASRPIDADFPYRLSWCYCGENSQVQACLLTNLLSIFLRSDILPKAKKNWWHVG